MKHADRQGWSQLTLFEPSLRMAEITSQMAKDFLLPRHYSGRTPSISKAFGWFVGNELKAVCSFGKPASNSLCVGICGLEYSSSVYELNRLCREADFDEPLSKFVAWCLRQLRQLNWIIVSYSDTAMNHHGYIYQACNFIYTGATKERTDIAKESGGSSHSRHYTEADLRGGWRKVRSSKHRYVYFCTTDKRIKKEWLSNLRYPICQYPKGDNNEDYRLGDYLKEEVFHE